MGNLTLAETKDQFKRDKIRAEKGFFIVKMVITILIYIGLSTWLNSIRITGPNWFVLVLAITQIIFYFLIFLISYTRLKVCGYKKLSWLVLVLTILGRFENWEIVFIPLLVIIMLIFTFFTYNLSLKEQEFFKQ